LFPTSLSFRTDPRDRAGKFLTTDRLLYAVFFQNETVRKPLGEYFRTSEKYATQNVPYRDAWWALAGGGETFAGRAEWARLAALAIDRKAPATLMAKGRIPSDLCADSLGSSLKFHVE
jgi:hypothetical protein